MILKCDCTCTRKTGGTKGAEFQDEQYGDGKRVHNAYIEKPKRKMARCTICGAERPR